MNLSKFFIDRPIFAWVIALVIMLAGILSILNLPINQYPNIAAPAVSIPGDLSMGVEGEPSRSKGSGSASPDPSADATDGGKDESGLDHETCAGLQQAWSTTNRALVDLSPEHPRALVQSFRTADQAMTDAEPL